jgi:hypothetical protein
MFAQHAPDLKFHGVPAGDPCGVGHEGGADGDLGAGVEGAAHVAQDQTRLADALQMRANVPLPIGRCFPSGIGMAPLMQTSWAHGLHFSLKAATETAADKIVADDGGASADQQRNAHRVAQEHELDSWNAAGILILRHDTPQVAGWLLCPCVCV